MPSPLPPKQPPPSPITWQNLPPARQQELTSLLATLLRQYLVSRPHPATSPPAQKEKPHERASQNP